MTREKIVSLAAKETRAREDAVFVIKPGGFIAIGA